MTDKNYLARLSKYSFDIEKCLALRRPRNKCPHALRKYSFDIEKCLAQGVTRYGGRGRRVNIPLILKSV